MDQQLINTDTGQPEAAPPCDADTQSSAANCGACGVVCNFEGAFPKCVEGVCHIESCAAGFYDLDSNEANGCEYACTKTNKGAELCDGIDNDCDGVADNGFDTMTDVNNCGACDVVCAAANATSACTAGKCTYACKPGYSDLGNTSGGGCYYACPVSPKAAEKCNGLDDDCDGTVDNGNIPEAGQPCQDICPNKQCKGECKPGTTVCTGTVSGLLCVGGVGPSPEQCDGLDNDCDGVVDNGINFQTDPTNCGQCGTTCGGGGSCVAGKCVLACPAGFVNLNGNPADGCEYQCPVFPTAVETCNGKDDDCDGVPDNAPSDVGQPCDSTCPAKAACVAQSSCAFPLSACVGACCGVCTQGATACINGQKVCQAGAGPQLEVCDGKDNNCDGQIDEGYALATDPLNCGSCGNACKLANAINKCQGGQCAVASCLPGYANLDNNASNGCEYTCPVNPPTVESCNGKDDDCNGLVDENLTSPANFCTQTSICAGAVPVCGGLKGWVCNYKSVNPNIEVDANGQLVFAETLCDGVDGNCNTQVDESFGNLGKPCSVGNGACKGSAAFQCSADKKSTVCPAQADSTKAVDEVCNGIDDNCDGQIDERVPAGSLQCYNGSVHPCAGWKDPMIKVGQTWIYQYEASRPDGTLLDAGSGSSRACSVASRLPWTNVTQTQAAAACAAIKDSLGKSMRLCTKAEWQAACTVGSTSNPLWAYASNPTTYAPWATGAGPLCRAVHTAGSIFDLSGNVAEWTSSVVNVQGQPYYSVLGGGYATLALGTQCYFDFVIQQPTFAYYDLGFRCCADSAP
jgi:hypothetical protein